MESSILTGKMDAYNTFEEPEVLKEKEYTDYTMTADGGLKAVVPPCSVVSLTIKK